MGRAVPRYHTSVFGGRVRSRGDEAQRRRGSGEDHDRRFRSLFRTGDQSRDEGGKAPLLRLDYNDEKSSSAAAEWAARYGADEAIVLYSDFVTDDDERMYGTGLEPGYTYRGWSWVLVRSHGGRWRLKNWGYG